MSVATVPWGDLSLVFTTTAEGATLPCPNEDGTITLSARQCAGIDPTTHTCGYRHDIDIYTNILTAIPVPPYEDPNWDEFPDGQYPPEWGGG